MLANSQQIGVLGEVHPLVQQHYDLPVTHAQLPLLAAEIDLDVLLPLIPIRYDTHSVPEYPPVLEDLALVVDDALPAEKVYETIRSAGVKWSSTCACSMCITANRLTRKEKPDIRLTYQAPDKTLTDKDVAGIRSRILRE
jgi:phenylalanyl-tRNA synthetase beta chain